MTSFEKKSLVTEREPNSVIDLKEVWGAIWGGKLSVVLITLCFAVGALVYSFRLPNLYSSEVSLAPVSKESKSGFAGLASQFSGIAGLAGINIGGSGMDKTALALEILQSRVFITKFIRKYQLEIPLMAAERWDHDDQVWVVDKDVYDENSNEWTRVRGAGKSSAPSDLELFKVFKRDVLLVKSDDKSGMVKVSISLMSPLEAKRWLSLIVADLNSYVQEQDTNEAERAIGYLKEQLEKTNVAEMQQVFFKLIEQQMRTVMLAEVREEYVFKTIDPAVVPEASNKPNRLLIFVAAIMLGGIVGVFYVIFRYGVKKKHQRAEITFDNRV